MPSGLLHMQKQIALPPSRCNLRKPEGYTLEVYYEDNKEDGLQEAPSYRKEQSDRQLRRRMPGRIPRRIRWRRMQRLRTHRIKYKSNFQREGKTPLRLEFLIYSTPTS